MLMVVHIGRSPQIHPIAKPTGKRIPHQNNIDNKVPRLGQLELEGVLHSQPLSFNLWS